MAATSNWEQDLGYITLRGLCSYGTGRTVIAIHGYLDNANSMIALSAAFPNDNFIALDLAGHGKSDHRPKGTHYNQLDYVQDLHQLVLSLNVNSVVLVGHSLGGIVASIYASTYPENVNCLISIDSLGPLVAYENTTQKQLRQAITSRSAKMVEVSHRLANLDIATALRAKKTDLSSSLCRYILERNITTDSKGNTVWSSDPRLRTKSLIRLTDAQVENLMRSIKCSMLVIAATGSIKQLASTLQHRVDWIDKLTFLELEGGHHVHLEKHKETVATIVEFVSEM